MLIEIIAIRLGTDSLLVSPIPVTVYRITGERDRVPAAKVTATDLLRLLEMEEAIQPEARAGTRKTLYQIARKRPPDDLAILFAPW